MGIGLRLNQLNIHTHLVGRFLHAPLKNDRYAKLLGDLAQIPGFALILLRGTARNHFQIRNASQPRQDLLLNAGGEIGVIWIATQIFERQHRNTFLRNRLASLSVKRESPDDQHCYNQQQSPDNDEVEDASDDALS